MAFPMKQAVRVTSAEPLWSWFWISRSLRLPPFRRDGSVADGIRSKYGPLRASRVDRVFGSLRSHSHPAVLRRFKQGKAFGGGR